jgi:hypothetical protein
MFLASQTASEYTAFVDTASGAATLVGLALEFRAFFAVGGASEAASVRGASVFAFFAADSAMRVDLRFAGAPGLGESIVSGLI